MSAIKASLVCPLQDLQPYGGVCALVGGRQVALFYLPGREPALHALDNWDPLGQANVLSRGIVGDVEGEPVVASPLYKQHFSLRTGQCLEQGDVRVGVYHAWIEAGRAMVSLQPVVERDEALS